MENDPTYIVILGWMRELNISLVERTVYAVIYGFSQDGGSTFNGSRQYLADWCGCTTKTIDAAIRKLIDRGLLTKHEMYVSGVKFCGYSANFPTWEKISLPGKNTDIGREKISHNNEDTIVSSNNDNIEIRGRARTRKDKDKFDFVAALVALGVDAQTARDWADIRKSKGARNTQSEYDYVVREILNACERYELTAQECVAFAAGNSWRGFRASWDEVRNIKKNDNEDNRKGVGGQPYYTGDTI